MTRRPPSTRCPARRETRRIRGLTFAQDRLGINVHSNVDSHIDALCHAMYRKTLYNGVPADAVTSGGAQELSIEVARDGIHGRGVLLDIPRLRGVPWLEPGDQVTAAELAAAAEAQQVSVGSGDLLFVRTGHRRRRDELGPWDAARARAGLHPGALEFIAEREVAVLGSDSNSDVAPSLAAGVDLPVHVLAINALGVHLLDYLQFEELVPLCSSRPLVLLLRHRPAAPAARNGFPRQPGRGHVAGAQRPRRGPERPRAGPAVVPGAARRALWAVSWPAAR